jgi:hypothetical protein
VASSLAAPPPADDVVPTALDAAELDAAELDELLLELA